MNRHSNPILALKRAPPRDEEEDKKKRRDSPRQRQIGWVRERERLGVLLNCEPSRHIIIIIYI